MDIEAARQNMVNCQLKTWDVFDQKVLDLFETVKRECFVPDDYRNLAFADTTIKIGPTQNMFSPKVEARILQALDIKKNEKVLEIGTGTGYFTSLLASLGREVISFEIVEDLALRAQKNIDYAGLKNVLILNEDGSSGMKKESPFDVIVLTGSVPIRPNKLEDQLATGGRLFSVIGETPVMTASLFTRVRENDWIIDDLFETDVEPLQGFDTPPVFEF